MQLTADLAGTELRVSTLPDCSPLGAVHAGQLGLGLHNSPADLAGLTRAETVHRPVLAREEVARLSRGWHHAVRQTVLPSA